ncbi:MAG: CDP-alcohol phosphatidyltransferase [Candidatus Magasanikbacteria bacterium GW2011_GWA2_56_11]|uniref:CDP-alcohol phosphatidyltransferase n=1 Tax=Candidatus Magasanikbacteria bacterium GW2011_GWA2_56_11 TaxID=1619044 RepID=A0A0G2AM26_9BACT|nr:MAG: CDP-alcohol phosphatidyltransferase [Candidatus Magasanikbacteria bacterium GW2011_GWA2_56_11]
MKLTYADYIQWAQKNTPQRYFDWLYRKVSHPVSFIFLRAGVSPTTITVASIILAVAAGAVLGAGYPVAGFLVFGVSYLLDFCDGNVARVVTRVQGMSEREKERGFILEGFNTNTALFSLYLGLGFYLSTVQSNGIFLLIGFLVFGAKLIARYTVAQAYAPAKTGPGAALRFSGLGQVKFFLSKCLFSANFYYVVYLVVFSGFPAQAAPVFVGYAVFDAVFVTLRLGRYLLRLG